MRKFGLRRLGLHAVASLSLAGVAFACATDPPEDFVPPGGSSSSGSSTVPGGDGGGSSSGGSSGSTSSSGGSSSGTSGTDGSTPAADCSKMGKVDDRPACDACTKQKCCAQLQACEASAACKQAQNCIAACASDDIFCVFECSATSGTGGQLLQDVGVCASQQCANECPSGFSDAGFDSPF